MKRRSSLWMLLVITLFAHAVFAQVERGSFRLHKFEQAIGTETYTITTTNGALTLESNFSFTDRGSTVPLKATLQAAADYTPKSFAIKGKTSRFSTVDTLVNIDGKNASVKQEQEKEARTTTTPQLFFTISGYAPVAEQMALMRYWRAHGKPSRLAILPSGEVQIDERGAETFTINGKPIQLQRYTVKGLAWGMQTLWMDNQNNLAALVTRDAEFDHFEAVRDEYEPALTTFVANAASGEMAELEGLSRTLPGRRAGLLAFTGATLIDVSGKAPVPNAVIITNNGKIMDAGPSGFVKIPAGAARVNVSGKFIIPGLWDMHAHYEQVEWGAIYLAAGVTTVRDVGNEFEFITSVRDRVNSGRGLGPHMLLAGIVDGDGEYALGVTRVNNAADAEKWVNKYHAAGFEQMKLYSSLTSANVKAVCDAAHKVGMTVTGHIPIGMDIYDGVSDGMDQVNHIQYVLSALMPKGFDGRKATMEQRVQATSGIDINSEQGKRLIAFLKEHGTVIDDTAALYDMQFRPANEPLAKTEPGVDKVAPELREQLVNGGMPPDAAVYGKLTMQKIVEILAALHKAGIPIIAGTDQGVPGYSVYREMEIYVQAGFTPLEALQAATIVPARIMKLDAQSGSIEAGKRADFDILDANPLENISNVRTVKSVVANGVFYDSAPLWQSAGFKP